MAVIQMGYNWKIDKTQKLAVDVSVAGKIYADTIQHKPVRYEVKLVPVTMQRVIIAMYEICCLKGGADSSNKSKNGQSGLNNNNVLRESKYVPGSRPQWNAGGSHYPNLYKALL